MLLTDELLRVLMDDRERDIRERIRVRRLIGPRQPAIRWRSGTRTPVRPPEEMR
jgi:hypothetical protein